MDRRTVIFGLLVFLLVLANEGMRVWWAKTHPRVPIPVAEQKIDPAKQADGKNAVKAAADAEKSGAKNAAVAGAAADAITNAEKPARTEGKPEWFTLGKLEKDVKNPKDKMLATFNARGATIERVEMQQFPYLEDHTLFHELRDGKHWHRAGYLGNLSTEKVEKGCKINVVGPGTPAADAGLEVGDVILGISGVKVKGKEEVLQTPTPGDLVDALLLTKPDDNVAVKLLRGDQEKSVNVKLGWTPVQVIRPEFEQRPLYYLSKKHDQLSMTMRVASLGKDSRLGPIQKDRSQKEIADAELSNFVWTGHRGKKLEDGKVDPKTVDNTVEFEAPLPGDLTVVKRYTLLPEGTEIAGRVSTGYEIQMEIEFKNRAKTEQKLAYQLDGPNGLPMDGWWLGDRRISTKWFNGLGVRDFASRYDGYDSEVVSTISLATDQGKVKIDGETAETSLAYAGIDSLYFSSVLLPRRTKDQQPWLSKVAPVIVGDLPGANPAEREKNKAIYNKLINVTSRMTTHELTVPANGTLRHTYSIFVGPKKPDLLDQVVSEKSTTLDNLVYFGWAIWGMVAHVMLGILHFFHSIIPNYGINIIMLTVLVRSCLFPLSRKQARSTAKMQELQPEMKRINEKYKDDYQARSKAMQEVYKKHNFNPFGGCLLAIIQLPIFIGLYRALSLDVELRGAPMFGEAIGFCSDLAAPDRLFYWEPYLPSFLASPTGYFGPYFNLLPLITVGLFLLQQRAMMPPPTDDQAKMQQSIMKFMTVFMGFMFYKVPAGLCIYFICGSIWGMVERKILGIKPAHLNTTGTIEASYSDPPSRSNFSSNGNGSNSNKKKKRDRR